MANSCTVRPRVFGPDGTKVDSILFKDLRKHLSYEDATTAYLMTKNPKFESMYAGKYKTDENGEPTYDSIKRLPAFRNVITPDVRKKEEEAKVKADEVLDATRSNIDAADDRAISYNNDASASGEYVAVTETYMDDDGNEKVHTVIKSNNSKNRAEATNVARKKQLNMKLRELLAKMNIRPVALSETEKKLRVAGVTDFAAAKLVANGMYEMIRLAKDQAGEDALPEEFSHLVLEALRDNPIVARLKTLIDSNNLEQEIIGDDYARYSQLYGGDRNKLINEAMGKLVASYILAQAGVEEANGYPEAKNLIQRLKAAFKQTFSQQDENEYMQALADIDKLAGQFADAIINSDLYRDVRVEDITSSDVYYELQDKVEQQKKLLEKIKENMLRRFAILESKSKRSKRLEARAALSKIEENLIHKTYEAGVYSFASDALEEMKEIQKKLQDIAGDTDTPFDMRARALKEAKDYISSYKSAVNAIMDAEFDGILEPDETRKQTLNEISDLVNRLDKAYERIASPMFVEIIKAFIGDGIEIPYGKMKGTKITAESLAAEAPHDIGLLDRWLDSMADSTDMVLGMMDDIVKNAKGRARLRTLRIKEEIDAAYLVLRKNGIRDTKFMYKHDPKTGKRTFEYISEKEAENLPLAQRNYYNTIMDIKARLDALLPDECTSKLNIIRIRKDFLDKVKSQTSAKGVTHTVLESIRDKFVRTAEDTEFGGQQRRVSVEGENGEEKSILLDFEDRQVDRLPIYYIKSRPNEDPDNISDDMNSTMLLYAQMACNYSEMSNVVSTLELMRERMEKRNVLQRSDGSAGKPLVNKIRVFEQTIENKYFKKGGETYIVQKMNDWFQSQVYGKYMKDDEGKILGAPVSKVANAINELTALNTYALNILSGISNVLTGRAMMRIEAIAGQFINLKELEKADLQFYKELPAFLGDVANPVKNSKLALFDELFNVMQDWESDLRGAEYSHSRLRRAASSNSLYILNNVGELYMQNRTAIGLALATKLKDSTGKSISLWDALTVVNENGVNKLKVKDGITKEDGTAFNDNDIIKFTNKSKAINQRMHGIYNNEDMNALQRTAVGRMALMFRKWMRPNLLLKYGRTRYNRELGVWEEGYFNTFGRFMQQLGKDIRRGQLDLATRYKELTPEEQINIKKSLLDAAQFLLVVTAWTLLRGIKDDDDDEGFEDTWAFQQLKYQTRRLQAELGATSPIGMPTELGNIIKSPAAGVTVLEDLWNMHHLITGLPGAAVGNENSPYIKRLQSGKYKGKTQAHKYLMESPFVPVINTIYRGFHPKESLQFFTQ